MKTVIKNKLLTLLASVFLALFCVIGVSQFKTNKPKAVTAETATPTITIQSKNLSYSDSIYILYAVSNEGFDRNQNNIQMLFWTETQTEYVLGTESYAVNNSGNATVKEKDCLIFYSDGIAVKEMTDDIYARACVTVDGVTYYSETVKYSVLEYVYEMREKGGLTEAKENLFDAMLEYGAMAQIVFNYNLERLSNATYYKIIVENGVMQDGFAMGRYQANDVVTITADVPEKQMIFSHWVDENDVVIGEEEQKQITVIAENTYTAVYSLIDLAYTLSNDGTYYSVTGIGTCTDTDIVIPNTYNGLPVTSIGEGAFGNCYSLTSVVIGENLTSIGDAAFCSCGLTRVVIPDGVTSIGVEVFYGCRSLTEVVIHDRVISIGNGAFGHCSNLTEIEIPDSVTNIGEKAFYYCSSLTEIVIPDSVTSIGAMAFWYCSNLTSIRYEGTIAQWYEISMGSSLNYNTQATEVVCLNGTVTL